ncbi:CBS domain-containing protein [Kitasatospora sp. NBC_00374]|uniref:CBS domain-containing protein n=1 Tax=Kitasatospora sp. NBC_00374 TaxID=2975964 RepID=UPI0030E19F31
MAILMTPPTVATAAGTVGAVMAAPDYQITDDTSIDRANDVLRGANVPYLVLRDHDGRCSGLVTRAQLAPFLADPRLAERVPIRDVAHDQGPYAWPEMAVDTAAVAMQVRSLQAWPVVDDEGFLLGVLTPDRLARAVYEG